jgi:sRNA-binding regulator protein Hfq
VYKHAISTIVPSKPVNLNLEPKAQSGAQAEE